MRLKNNIFLLILLSLIITIRVNAQCPAVDFSAPASVCVNEKFAPGIISTGDTFAWDFCTGDLNKTPQAEFFASFAGANGRPGLEFANQGGKWYGFLTGTNSNVLYRMEFANGLSSQPTLIENVTALTNNKLNGPGQIRIIQENNSWYGFIINTPSGELLKLDFGNSLSNAFTTSVQVSGLPGGNTGLALGKDVVNGWTCVLSTASNQFTMIRLGNSFNTPTPSDIITSGSVPNPNNLGDLDLVNVCGLWYAFADNLGNGNVYRLDFGSNLFSDPVINQINTITAINPGRLRIAKDGKDYFVLIITLEGTLVKLKFGEDPTSAPTIVYEGNIGGALPANIYGLAVGKDNSVWTIRAVDASNGKVYQINYVDDCSASVKTSTEENPLINYAASGTYEIALEATNSAGTSVTTKPINVSAFIAPDISLTSQNICVQHDVNFASVNTSGDITTYDWDFGDGGAHASTQDPIKQFGIAGTYEIDLLVTAGNGCKNHAYETIRIYDVPSAVFTLPAGLICTNNEFTFVNGVTDNFDGNLSYQWLVENNPVSTDRDLKHTFTNGGDHDIMLRVSIPGCADEETQSVNNVQVGPVVGFSQAGQCEGNQISFTNSSSGNIAGFDWNFGNGNTSTEENPVQTFSTKGTYTVSLETTGANGCVSSTSKQVIIYSKPQPDFSVELPPFSCSGTPSQFTNTTPNPTDSNVASWAWQFGDTASGSSVNKNPLYTYSNSGDYDVTLTATTNFNCSSSTTRTITIAQGPPIAFSNTPSCANQGTRFTDESGSDIRSWLWTIGNSTYSFSNPTHVFSSPGTYNVQLTVTGNNNCVATLSKNVTVPVAPELDFTFSDVTCIGQPVTFEDSSPTAADPAASYSWTFEGTAKSGSLVQYSFAEAGTYNVKMTSVRESGCMYSISKSVSISPAPVAKFSANPEWGTSPLSVQFTNQSTGADTYLWTFNDKNGSTSTDSSPAFQFTDLGEYVVDLVATNAQGCSSTVSSKISVIVPSLDVELTNLNLIKDPSSGTYRIMVTIKNKSNFVLTSADVIVDISGNARIKETISTTISPDGEVSQLLTNQIVPGSLFTYLCAELDMPSDIDAFNNKICESVSDEGVTFAPYPNPSNGEFHFDWISQSQGEAHFVILSSMGQMVFEQEVTVNGSGFNQAKFDLTSYQTGIYFFKFSSGSLSKTTRIVILR